MPRAPKKPRKSGSKTEDHRIRSVDDLALYDRLMGTMLKDLKEDLANGLTPEDLRHRYASLAQARGINVALTDADPKNVLAAVKDILDRSEGKAKERKEIEHTLGKLSEKELDALIISEQRAIDHAESD